MLALQRYLCGLMLVFPVFLFAAGPIQPSDSAPAQALASVPAWFEPNQGLHGTGVRYFARGNGYTLLLKDSGATLSLADDKVASSIAIGLAGGNPRPIIEPADPLPGRTTYLVGNRPGQWKSNVPQFGRVRYREAYPGIDLIYRSSGRQLEYDFVVAPGVNPSVIRLHFSGANSVRLDREGTLVLGVGEREIRQPKPYVFQEVAGTRRAVAASYVLTANREVRFKVGSYDRAKPLVIDPVLVYAGYFGGNAYDLVTGISHDPDGTVWLTGTTMSTVELPVQNEPHSGEIKGARDAFLAKLSIPANGIPTLLYWTYLGGADHEWGGQILVDAAGTVYVTGSTASADFPKTDNAFSSKLGGAQNTSDVYNQDAFVVQINPASPSGADSLMFSSFLGGSGLDAPMALSFDNSGKLLVAGYTASLDLDPLVSTTLQPANRGGYDAFIYQIDPAAAAGETLIFSTYFGGRSTDVATGVGMDTSGAVYLTGYTLSDDLPIAGDSHQSVLKSPAGDLFVAKLDLTKTNLDTLVYGTYLGGSSLDIAESMRMDDAGAIWLAGYTLSQDLPVTQDAYQAAPAGGAADAFLMRLDLSRPPADIVAYSTYLGGSGTDICYDLALMGGGKVALTGYSLSDNFPVLGAPATGVARRFMADAFVAVLDTAIPGAGALTFSTYFGGTNQDVGLKVLPDRNGNIYVSGSTFSKTLPVTDGSQKMSPFGSASDFLLRFDKAPGE